MITELNNTAEPLISMNKACIEKCIRKLKSEVEELEMKRSLDTDSHYKVLLLLTVTEHRKQSPYNTTVSASKGAASRVF